MEQQIDVTSPTYGRRLVREIRRRLDSKKYVYLVGPEGKSRVSDVRLYGGEFIEVTIENREQIFIPSEKREKVFIDGYGRLIVASRKVMKTRRSLASLIALFKRGGSIQDTEGPRRRR